jgi:Family of unknown function (DUF6263)
MSLARTLVCSIAMCALLQAPAAAQTDLRYQFKEGEKTYYDLNQKVTMKVNANGVAIEVKIALAMDLTWEIMDVNPASGIIKLAIKVDHFRIDANSQGQGYIIDSAEPRNDEEKSLKAALGQGIVLEMRDNGEVTKIENADAVIRALQKLQAGGIAPTKDKLLARNALHPIWLTFPAGKLRKGQSWTVLQNSGVQKDFGTVKQDGKFTYQGQNTVSGKKLELFDYQIAVKLEPDAEGTVQGKITKQESKGHVHFDPELGREVDGTVNQSVDMEFTDNSGDTATLSIIQELTCKNRAKPKTKDV